MQGAQPFTLGMDNEFAGIAQGVWVLGREDELLLSLQRQHLYRARSRSRWTRTVSLLA